MLRFYKTLILLILLVSRIQTQSANLKFEHLSMDDGLAASRIFDILQDQHGFMWFGTEAGLHKYDGYNFTIYTSETNNPKSISDNFITRICEDCNGDLWLGTYSGGLNQFDYKTGEFRRYVHNSEDSLSLSNDNITTILALPQDSGQVIWVGTDRGLNRLDVTSGKFKRLLPLKRFEHRYSNHHVSAIYYDKSANLLVGTVHGLFRYISANDSFDTVISKIAVKCIYQDINENLWVGTAREGGLYKLPSDLTSHQYYKHQEKDSNSLSIQNISTITEDLSGNLWIGSYRGLNLYMPKKNHFMRIYHNPGDAHSLSGNFIQQIYQGRTGPLWIATSVSLNKLVLSKNKFEHYQLHTPLKNIPGFRSVRALHKDSGQYDNYLWVGGWGGGLFRFDAQTGALEQSYYKPYIGGNYIKSIFQDPNNQHMLWLGTWGSGVWLFDKRSMQYIKQLSHGPGPYFIYTFLSSSTGSVLVGSGTGLYIFNPQDYTYLAIDDPTLAKINDFITCIFEDDAENLWLGTYYNGLKKLHYTMETNGKISSEYSYYRHDPHDIHGISSNSITFLDKDSHGNFWIGTKGGGLNKYLSANDKFKHYTKKDGLPSNIVYAMTEDDHGNLWISSQNGLVRFYPENEIFRIYDVNDGLQCNEFNPRVAARSPDGIMYFGGSNGFNIFHPDSIRDNRHIPPVVFTDFRVFNKSIQPGTGAPFKECISEVEKITLTHHQDVFSFEFAALDYCCPQKNKYAYQMEGVDPDWVYTNASRRYANYTRLTAGDYIFRVRGSNNDGLWNEKGRQIKITILPPWWQTIWAYLIYMCVFAGTIWAIWRSQLNRLRIKHELEMEHVHAQKLQEIDHIKSRFYANISHEFRTPLTLILGPIENMLKRLTDQKSQNELSLIKRNADRLHRLINQLLDLSKLDAGAMQLRVREENIVQLTKNYVQYFESLAIRKQINLKFISKNKFINVFVDRGKIEQVLNNLLSNAIKFTPENGEIRVSLKISKANRQITSKSQIQNAKFPIPSSDFVEITISDTGIGIPADRLDKIFDRFYQVEAAQLHEQEGTGIGLALTKELVELHHGQIEVTSEKDSGTTFTVRLFLGKNHFKSENFIPSDLNDDRPGVVLSHMENQDHAPNKPVDMNIHCHEMPVLLIVEDNHEMRAYLREHLDPEYQILEAKNGMIGFDLAAAKLPDLIISDVMMPGMDGFEFCAKIKSDEQTSHIPVILLTSRAAREDRITGFETGADDYIPKPFDIAELYARIKNLIGQRNQLRQRFSREAVFSVKDIAVTSMDEKFLNRAITVIEQQISNADFDVEDFIKIMAISRAHLYRKLHALTGQSVKQFIRTIRLKYAAQLLSKKTGNISEIAYEAGFNNPSYFSGCFRRQFGQTPTEFVHTRK
jgi:signal transduction histidine kinase/ligand-binding sensor domain-containing protein/DNA-binding response OmpR family regulator